MTLSDMLAAATGGLWQLAALAAPDRPTDDETLWAIQSRDANDNVCEILQARMRRADAQLIVELHNAAMKGYLKLVDCDNCHDKPAEYQVVSLDGQRRTQGRLCKRCSEPLVDGTVQPRYTRTALSDVSPHTNVYDPGAAHEKQTAVMDAEKAATCTHCGEAPATFEVFEASKRPLGRMCDRCAEAFVAERRGVRCHRRPIQPTLASATTKQVYEEALRRLDRGDLDGIGFGGG